MMEILMKADERGTDAPKSDLKFGTSTEYVQNDTSSSVENVDKLTTVQKFYDGQNIFITGGTGFMGKLLIEKLLRGCPGINCIYVLIRKKKEKNVLQRKEELINDMVFSVLRKEQPEFQKRIVAIEGDCSLPNLGISIADRTTLIGEVSIVFHSAATVRFNEKIKFAGAINVRSLKEMIHLSLKMSKLKSFVHVSTAYANCPHNTIEEKFYDPPMDANKFIDLLDTIDEKLLDNITPQLLGEWPNVYVYTKSIAENIVKKHAGLMPIGIFRPAIVMPTHREPICGWIDNIHGLVRVTAGGAMGLMRTNYCDKSVNVEIVPGDLTINALIVSAWDIANNRRFNEDIPIYNYVSKENPINFEEITKLSKKYTLLLPTNNAIWYCSFTNIKYRPIYLLYMCFLHLLPALIVDTIAFCIGKKPRLLKIYNKIHTVSNISVYFTTKEWVFINKRWNELLNKVTAKDRELFFCDMKDLVWETYFQSYILGIRTYIIKDPIETLPQARLKFRRLYWMHQALKLVIACVLLMITWAMFSRLL
ncbi:fatty acyl-CoA reductase wat-like [Vespula pensylvanica]|uniref:fatty acyl-CoA reductase wat-like n=1 Tax=Vespula pensylvanica TaxID=30213 RepID=UPI001CB9F269|nr:fatty acyl-CoA reductase wat-like [Vespula pensylvanica]